MKNSNKFLYLLRADGWCESVVHTSEWTSEQPPKKEDGFTPRYRRFKRATIAHKGDSTVTRPFFIGIDRLFLWTKRE